MGRKQDQIAALLAQGKKHEADILGAGGRQAQAAKIEELANRVDASGFIYKGDTYTLRSGEDYYSLAQRLYGNTSYFSILAKYNNGLIPKAGMTIKIPRIRAVTGSSNVAADVSGTPATTAPGVGTTSAPTQPPGIGYPATNPGGTNQNGDVVLPSGATPGGLRQGLGAPAPLNVSSLGGANAGASATPQVGSYAWKQGIESGSMPQVSLTAPQLPTNRMAGEQPTFANPQTGQQQPTVKPGSSGGGNEADIVQSQAINIATQLQNTGRPAIAISNEAAELLGVQELLADPNSGYNLQGDTWRPDQLAQYILNNPANTTTPDFNLGGSVPRPDIVYRRRTPAELTKGDAASGSNAGGYSYYPQPFYNDYSNNALGAVINWRVGFG